MSRYAALESRLSPSHFEAVRESRVLVVGAGGIGCEVLKNLVMAGFRKLDTIDLDIIDPSNLNRQFLFRPEHVNHPKATVAAQSAMAFNPDAEITAFHKNVKDTDFNAAFFSKYDIVLNALDNVDARRHVNRLCLASNTPLIESGTTGYVGQVMPIVKGQMECYECRPKATAKVYPICTIRSTPDKPVHCIVWAKELFKLILGPTSESMLFESALSGDSVESSSSSSTSSVSEKGVTEYSKTSEYMKFVAFPVTLEPTALECYARAIFLAVFGTEVTKQIEAGVYKTSKKVPVPITSEVVDKACSKYAKQEVQRPSSVKGWERRVWNTEENLIELMACLEEVWNSSRSARNEGSTDMIGSYVFDKDFRLSMLFVTAASNLRSEVFNIPTMSFHDAKGVAGNIIPAIASTNAIIAGLQVAEAIQLLGRISRKEVLSKEKCKSIFCQRYPTRRGYYLQPIDSSPPNEDCYVCNSNQQTLEIDTKKFTLGEFVKRVVKGKLGLVEPSIVLGASVIYEEGEDMDDSLLQHTETHLESLPAGGIQDSTLVTLEDFVQDLKVTLLVRHIPSEEFDEEETPEGFRVTGSSVTTSVTEKKASSKSKELAGSNEHKEEDDDVCVILDSENEGDTPPSKKRRLEHAEEEVAVKKQAQ